MGPFLAFLAAVLTVAGNIFAKEWAVKKTAALFAITIILYLASSVAFPFSLRYGSLTILNTLASVAIIIFTAAIGLFYYREQISTLQSIGLILGVMAILLMLSSKA